MAAGSCWRGSNPWTHPAHAKGTFILYRAHCNVHIALLCVLQHKLKDDQEAMRGCCVPCMAKPEGFFDKGRWQRQAIPAAPSHGHPQALSSCRGLEECLTGSSGPEEWRHPLVPCARR